MIDRVASVKMSLALWQIERDEPVRGDIVVARLFSFVFFFFFLTHFSKHMVNGERSSPHFPPKL